MAKDPAKLPDANDPNWAGPANGLQRYAVEPHRDCWKVHVVVGKVWRVDAPIGSIEPFPTLGMDSFRVSEYLQYKKGSNEIKAIKSVPGNGHLRIKILMPSIKSIYYVRLYIGPDPLEWVDSLESDDKKMYSDEEWDKVVALAAQRRKVLPSSDEYPVSHFGVTLGEFRKMG